LGSGSKQAISRASALLGNARLFSAVFAATVCQYPQKRYPVRVEERDHLQVQCVWRFDPSLMCLADQMGVGWSGLAPGCVVEMEKDGRLHLGYAIDERRMIHASLNEGVIVEDIGTYPVKGYLEIGDGLKLLYS